MRKELSMNNNMYPNYTPPVTVPSQGGTQPPIQNMPGGMNPNIQALPGVTSMQPPYAENLLKKNQGKMATFYMSYSDSVEWRDKIFTGIIEDSGRDYALLSDPHTGKWTLLWLVYINYVEFDEAIIHN